MKKQVVYNLDLLKRKNSLSILFPCFLNMMNV